MDLILKLGAGELEAFVTSKGQFTPLFCSAQTQGKPWRTQVKSYKRKPPPFFLHPQTHPGFWNESSTRNLFSKLNHQQHLTTVHILYHKNWSQKRDPEALSDRIWITACRSVPYWYICHHTIEHHSRTRVCELQRETSFGVFYDRPCAGPTSPTWNFSYQSHLQEIQL